MLTDPDDWRKQAECLGADPTIFYPTSLFDAGTVLRARAICGRCPVRETCLEHALSAGERDGIWGGLTPPELTTERRRRGGLRWRQPNDLGARRPRTTTSESTERGRPAGPDSAPVGIRDPEDPRHGTYGGCRAHRRAGEKPCEPCRIADLEYQAEERIRRAQRQVGAAS